jgi:hypothetical protein
VLAESDLAEQARQAFRESVAAGQPLTGAVLGAQCGRSDRWGRARIAEARADMPAEPDSLPQAGGTSAWWDQPAAAGPVVPAEPVADVPEPVAAEPEPVAEVLAEVQGPPEPVAAEPEPVAEVVAETPVPTVALERTAPAVVADEPLPQRRGARAVSWVAFVFGVIVSVAANVAHTFYPTADQLTAWRALHPGTAWQPELGPQLAAAFWPVALLLAVEVLSRVRWRAGLWWSAARYGGTGTVALVAAVMSYRHMAGLLTAYGEDSFSAHVGPLAVDGLMVVAGFALLSLGASVAKRQ